MTMLYNTEPANANLVAVKGDTLDMHFYVNYELTATGKKFYVALNASPADGVPYSLGALNVQVRRKDNLLIKDWLGAVSPADIVVSGNEFHLFDADGFLENGLFDFAVQEFDGVSGFKTIISGSWWVKKEITI